jgi:flagellar basal-body rod protein FlgB
MIDYGIINMLSKELDTKTLRNELIASNIANVDTPGYKAKDLDFKTLLSEKFTDIEMKRTDPRHISFGGEFSQSGVKIVTDRNPGRADGNNVNIESEMLKLTENNIQYNVAVHLVSKKLTEIREAIKEASRG